MSSLYPEIEPFDHVLLDTGDGNRIYWETCGNPAGPAGTGAWRAGLRLFNDGAPPFRS